MTLGLLGSGSVRGPPAQELPSCRIASPAVWRLSHALPGALGHALPGALGWSLPWVRGSGCAIGPVGRSHRTCVQPGLLGRVRGSAVLTCPPSRHCREPFSPQCWGAAGGGPRPVRVPAVSGACSLHKALACTRPLVVLYFAVFICMYRVFVMRQRLHLSPLACGSSPGELVSRLRSRRLHSHVGCPWTALCILGWTSLIKGV